MSHTMTSTPEVSSSWQKRITTRIVDNWKSGLAVALVSIPLSVSLAIAAGATPLMGILTAIWAGLFAAAFGGSHYNITGPTGALSGILAAYAVTHGVQTLPALAIATGIIILVVYLLRLDKYIIFIPASVIHGFTLGVAFIISLNQFNFAFGLSGLTQHEKFIANIWESFSHIGQFDPVSLLVAVIGFLFLLVCARYVPRIPGAIILAPIGILLGWISSNNWLPFTLKTLYTKFGDINMKLVDMPHFSLSMFDKDLIITSITVAVVAILETLISGKIADGMTDTKFNRREEVFGLSLGNIFSGIFGGIPATAALARTALNVKSNANHSTSALISCFFIIILSALLFPLFKFLPLPIIAAILVNVAVRMVQREHFEHLYKFDKVSFWISLLVAVITIVEDPIVGILVGAVLALLLFVKKLSEGQGEVNINIKDQPMKRITTDQLFDEEDHGDVLVYRFIGMLNYVNSLSHIETIERLNKPHTVVLSLRNVFFIDVDGLEGLEEIVEILEKKGMKVLFSGVNAVIAPLITHQHFYVEKEKGHMVYETTSDALKSMGVL